MRYPKPQKKKKRMRHKKSILHEKDGTCYLCMKLHGDYRYHTVLHEHHVYGGANRKISESEGFKVYLCLEHHTAGPAAVHNNQEYMRILQEDMQREFEKTHTRQEFMSLIGKNYLDEESEGQQEVEEPGFFFLEDSGSR